MFDWNNNLDGTLLKYRINKYAHTIFGTICMSGASKDNNQHALNEKDVPSKRVNVNSSEIDAEKDKNSAKSNYVFVV